LTANLFFVPSAKLAGSIARLDGAEHHHLRVARLRPGDTIGLFDEEGNRVRAEIEAVNGEATRLRILQRERPEDVPLSLTLVQSLLKSKTMDDVVEQAAEWGLGAVVPVSSERTIVKVEGREDRKVERWRQIARSAAEQCKSGRVPRVDPPRPLAALLADPPPGRRIVLSEHGGRPLKDILAGAPSPAAGEIDAWVLLVGPEGGWSEREIEAIVRAGFEAASLGPHILRAGTAAIGAAAIIIHQRGF
jgi:16S rRNA (uracil1498-N3)-methyltransferase